MDWSWAIEGVTDEVPRTTGPECINYMTNRRRWLESIIFTIIFLIIIRRAVKRLEPIEVPFEKIADKPHSTIRLILLLTMTLIFGIEMGFKFANKSVIFVLNPCHIQTLVQIYLLAAKPNKVTTALFRIQMNNLNGPVLAFMFPEVECRTLPFEQATYWVQHALLYIIPAYIIKSGAYQTEELSDYNWVTIGVMIMLIYHFVILNALSIQTGINLNHMLCAAIADPFQGQNYRVAAVFHESILCPILNKTTVFIFKNNNSKAPLEVCVINQSNQTDNDSDTLYYSHPQNFDFMSTPPEKLDISLAAEMAAATGESVNMILKHRFRHEQLANLDLDVDLIQLNEHTDIGADALTAEYTMPTTKID